MKNLIIASTSTIFGGEFLEYLLEEISQLFSHTEEIVFVPYARPDGISHDAYTEKAARVFTKIGKKLVGIHTFPSNEVAIKNAKGIFIGGGNTFLLVSQLYKYQLMEPLRAAIHKGLPYLGASAGSNICGVTMQNTNDMPIVYPPSFKTLAAIPFNINPHYLDPDPTSKHMGETRETRIKEFHTQNSIPVLGLREGSWLQVKGDEILLKGNFTARLFEKNKMPIEIDSGGKIQL